MKLAILFLMVGSAWAADVEPAKHPAVSEKARGDFWKAAVMSSQADAAKLAADNNKKAAVEAMQKECGDWELQQDPQTLEPICVEKKDAQIDAQAKSKALPTAKDNAQQAAPVSGGKP